jgi:hypothetical protein
MSSETTGHALNIFQLSEERRLGEADAVLNTAMDQLTVG